MKYAFILFVIKLPLFGQAIAEEKSIYKKYNDEGVVEFSDTPDKDTKLVPVPPMNTYKQKPLPRNFKKKVEPKDQNSYKSLSISNPVNDTIVRENAGNVSITITSKPALRKQHSLKVVLNGDNKTALEGKTSSFTFNNVSRGTHKVQAFIIDKGGKTLISSDVVLFHLQRVIFKKKSP